MNELSEITSWASAGYVALTFLLGYWYGYDAGKASAKREFHRREYEKKYSHSGDGT